MLDDSSIRNKTPKFHSRATCRKYSEFLFNPFASLIRSEIEHAHIGIARWPGYSLLEVNMGFQFIVHECHQFKATEAKG